MDQIADYTYNLEPQTSEWTYSSARKTKNCLARMYCTFNLEFLIEQDHKTAGN